MPMVNVVAAEGHEVGDTAEPGECFRFLAVVCVCHFVLLVFRDEGGEVDVDVSPSASVRESVKLLLVCRQRGREDQGKQDGGRRSSLCVLGGSKEGSEHQITESNGHGK